MKPPDWQNMPAGKPDAEVDVTETLVRRLLSDQHADLAQLPLSLLDSGWDNVIYRLGDALTVRVPRRQMAAEFIANELTWLPVLAPALPIPVPAPERLGTPTDYYPWRWGVLPYFQGECADVRPPIRGEARRFADFLLALHRPAPDDAPKNPVRGVPIRVREPNTRERMTRLKDATGLLTPVVMSLWEAALDAPDASESRWLHGDLHSQNVLVRGDGSISAVIDWGDVNGGDVATDLAGIWALFDSAEDRRLILERYDPDPALLARAKGWAVIFGVVLTDSGLINSPRHAAAGGAILRRLAAEGT
jgi:aminoglycoside phosphotransferase (APT) family kinase protein